MQIGCASCAGYPMCDECYAVYSAERRAQQVMHDLMVWSFCNGALSLPGALCMVGFEDGWRAAIQAMEEAKVV